jgi:glycerophosphoryl diester phosphodiesterase
MAVPQVVAHRGYASRYVENTMAALEGAAQAGARWVEVDVQLSADRKPFLFHDKTLRRLCGRRGTIHQCSAAEIRSFKVRLKGREPRPVPDLGELRSFLARHKEVRAFVEAKPETVEAFGAGVFLREILKALGTRARRCVLISFSLEFLQTARKEAGLPLGFVARKWKDRLRPEVRALKPEYLFVDRAELPVWGRLESGPRLCVYEVRQPRLARRLFRRGVELVEGMDCGRLIQGLEELR